MKKNCVKKVAALLLALVMVFAFAACGNGGEKKGLKIGIAANGWTTNPVFVDLGNSLRAEAEADGITLYEISVDTAEDVTAACESFIASGCDGVILQAVYAEAAIAMMPAMIEAGIAVSIYDNDLSEYGSIYNALLDNYAAGYALGKAAAEWANEHIAGEVQAAVAECSIVEIFRPRGDGIVDGLNATLNNGSVVFRDEAYLQEQAVDFVENANSAYPGLNLVVCWNGGSGVGAYEGSKGLGWNNRSDVGVFSCDASQDELAGILENGSFIGTLDLDLSNQLYQLYTKTVEYIENGHAYPDGVSEADKTWYFPLTVVYADTAADYVIK